MAGQDVIGPDCQERFLALDIPAAAALRDLGVQLAGVSALAPPYRMVRSRPDFHCVVGTTGGAGWCEIAGCPPRLGSGELLVIPAGTPCAYGIRGRRWDIAWFHLDARRGLGAALARRPAAVHQAVLLPRLAGAMEAYLTEARDDDVGAQRAAALAARLVACQLERELAADLDPRAAQARRRLQELWDAVDRDLRRRWTVAELAARLHESPASLFRLCAKHGGERPMAMVARLRLERARLLLRESDEPLKAVAARVGYRNAFAFSAAFKRFAGVSPQGFRARR